jgi:hypothetical protein
LGIAKAFGELAAHGKRMGTLRFHGRRGIGSADFFPQVRLAMQSSLG